MTKRIDSVADSKATGLIVQREGDRLVLTDPAGKQYECRNGAELWDDVLSILGDATLPKMLVAAPSERRGGAGTQEIDAQAFFEDFCAQAGAVVGDAYGPFFGRIAEQAGRRGGPAALTFLKKISRNSKPKDKGA